MKDKVYSFAVIEYIDPVSHISTGPVYWNLLIFKEICDKKWYKFFRILIWSKVVGASRDYNRKLIGGII